MTCPCEAVFNRWCVKLMMKNARALNMPFSFFPFFSFSTEWPCLIDWSPESTTDRHIQSSTQTDDGDGREEKKRRSVWKKKRTGKYHGESNQGADCSLSLYLYTMWSNDHEVLVFVLLDCMNSCLIDINGSYHHALQNKKKRITKSSSLWTGNVSVWSMVSFVSQRKKFEFDLFRQIISAISRW